jgi:hypothetical protein
MVMTTAARAFLRGSGCAQDLENPRPLELKNPDPNPLEEPRSELG